MPKQIDNFEIIELTEKNIESMVYFIRGQKVMLDFDFSKNIRLWDKGIQPTSET